MKQTTTIAPTTSPNRADATSMEDWVLPSGRVPAVTDEAGYRQRLAEALAADSATGVFYTWGFHHYFHGSLSRAVLDEMSPTRPVVVWHRSAHEMVLNSAALEFFGITPEFHASLSGVAREQSNLEEGHFGSRAGSRSCRGSPRTWLRPSGCARGWSSPSPTCTRPG